MNTQIVRPRRHFPGMRLATCWQTARRCNGRGFTCGAIGFHAWWIVFSCQAPQNPTFPATFGELRNFVNAMWVERSRGKFMEATCSSRVRARLTKWISNRRPVKNSTIFPSTSPSSRSWPALEARYPGRADRVEVVDYFDRDEILWPICLTCVELLAARMRANRPVSRR
jgi:hypothetical protein